MHHRRRERVELKKNNREHCLPPFALLAVVPSDDGARGVKDSSDRAACVRHSGSLSISQSVAGAEGGGLITVKLFWLYRSLSAGIAPLPVCKTPPSSPRPFLANPYLHSSSPPSRSCDSRNAIISRRHGRCQLHTNSLANFPAASNIISNTWPRRTNSNFLSA